MTTEGPQFGRGTGPTAGGEPSHRSKTSRVTRFRCILLFGALCTIAIPVAMVRLLRPRRTNLSPTVREAAGLELVPYTVKGDESYLDVEMSKVKRCYPGDLEAIALDLESGGTPSLLMTVEALGGGEQDRVVAAQPLSLADIEAQRHFLIRIPAPLRPTAYGVFLCSDRASRRRCKGKETIDFERIFSTRPSSRTAGIVWDDKTYAFNLAVLDSQGVAFPKQGLFEQSQRERMPPLARAIGAGAENDLADAVSASLAMRSFPMRVAGNAVAFQLAGFAGEACAQSRGSQGPPHVQRLK